MKTSISVELIPENEERILRDADVVVQYEEITHINVTDLGKYALRSGDAVRLLRRKFGDRFVYIPHVRASAPQFMLEKFPGDIALVVRGDTPSTDRTALEQIASLSRFMPVMAGIDPYRTSFQSEFAYMRSKITVGASGFFTQPFFSLDHLRHFESIVPGDCELFYGVSPVTTEKTFEYWKMKNNVIFPHNFSLTLGWQAAFARKVIGFAKQKGRSVYLMPIRTPLAEYLEKVFQ